MRSRTDVVQDERSTFWTPGASVSLTLVVDTVADVYSSLHLLSISQSRYVPRLDSSPTSHHNVPNSWTCTVHLPTSTSACRPARSARLCCAPPRRDEHQTTTLEAFRTELTSANLIPSDRDESTKRLGYDRYDDQTLLRFLRARKFDIPKARLMWENNEKWRKEFGADDIAA